MNGGAIAELNAGLATYKDELAADSLATKRVEVAVVTFGGNVEVVSDFATAERYVPAQLVASGQTPMGEAIEKGLDLLETRKAQYRAGGVSYYRPWVFLITDGGPTDSWQNAATRVRQGEARKSFMFFAVGTKDANFETLKKIAPDERPPLRLDGLRFRDLFKWLSSSQQAVSRSQTTDVVPLQNPAAPGGWGSTT
jgi:uncharacterized protein YegL